MRIAFCSAVIALVSGLMAQELPTPEMSPSPTVTPAPSATATATASATVTPALSPARSVRISFVPPPLDGTISLGIYDTAGKLVRVLHQQVALDAFTIGADALHTKWDGKDDDGQDLPAGKYAARGYVVGAIQMENLGLTTTESPPPLTTDKVSIKLISNPLGKNKLPTVELTIGFDDTHSFLKTIDDLPLFVISERADITKVALAKNAEKSIDVWQESGAGTEHFRLSKLDQIMAFDCGAFDLK